MGKYMLRRRWKGIGREPTERDERGTSEDIGQGPDRSSELKSCRGVESSRRVVPSDDGSTVNKDLGDGDSLSLSSRDSSDELVTDERVGGVLDTERLEEKGEEFYVEKQGGKIVNKLRK
jgi:hypothetical protein